MIKDVYCVSFVFTDYSGLYREPIVVLQQPNKRCIRNLQKESYVYMGPVLSPFFYWSLAGLLGRCNRVHEMKTNYKLPVQQI